MKLLVPVFSLTLFLSAFLLFGVQPLFSKMVLPYLGGSPMVWNTAMVFFQAMLLAGYGYAYFNSKLKSVTLQLAIHAIIFIVFLSFLPFTINAADIPSEIPNPTLWQIGLMLATIGPPFFILSGCAPLLQSWFAKSSHPDSHNPYFLYAASNVGSMLALLSYPFVTEPLFGATEQVHIWSGLYVVLICMIGISGLLVIKNPAKALASETVQTKEPEKVEKPTWALRGLWLLLSFVPSSLMLGVTTYMTTDIASVPLLWIIPLAIYVGTFIIAFANKRMVSTETMAFAHNIILLLLVLAAFMGSSLPIEGKIIFHIVAFSIITLSCHMRLADFKPHSNYLTEFYFLMSLGGVLGGIFNALLAPVIFTYIWEYTIVLILSGFLIHPLAIKTEIANRNFFRGGMTIYKVTPVIFLLAFGFLAYVHGEIGVNSTLLSALIFTCAVTLAFCYNLRVVFASLVLITLIVFPIHSPDKRLTRGETIFIERNFFGTTRVVDNERERYMLHGTTVHGLQLKEDMMRTTGYYNDETAIGEVFTYFTNQNKKDMVGILGLGIGGLACHTAPGREFEFYEIDPDVAKIAEDENMFTYLKECGNPYKIIIGDARLKVNEVPDGHYDLLVVDVFSSDNIPVHLMTEEAIALYLQKLDENGVLLLHISNRHINLKPVLSTLAHSLGVEMLHRTTMVSGEVITEQRIFPTRAVVLAKNANVIEPLKQYGWETYDEEPSEIYHWTDEYVNIISAFKLYREIMGMEE